MVTVSTRHPVVKNQPLCSLQGWSVLHKEINKTKLIFTFHFPKLNIIANDENHCY